MFSNRDRLLERQKERTYGSTSNNGVENPEFSASAPAVLEPSMDTSRPSHPVQQRTIEDSDSPPINPWRTLITCSCPASWTTVPTRSNDQSNVSFEEIAATDEQVEEPSCYFAFQYWYMNAAIRFRHSKWIYLFQLLFSLIPISSLVMGGVYFNKCTDIATLPIYSGIAGIIGIGYVALWMAMTFREVGGYSRSFKLYMFFLVFFVVFWFLSLIDVCIFTMVMPKNNPKVPLDCDKTLLDYTSYKQIATGVFLVLAAIIYIPGYRNNYDLQDSSEYGSETTQ